MSITSALSTALSGLTASARSADVVSSNVSNVLTEGYARRDVMLSPQKETGGVRVLGVTRDVDTRLLSDRRIADAGSSHAERRAGFLAELEAQIGLPDTPYSLSGRVAAFEASLITAASAPQDDSRLAAVIDAAGQVAQSFRAASGRIEDLRTEADTSIAGAVETVNTTLQQIARLNAEIVATDISGRSTAALEDHRQVAIDRIAAMIPLREVPRDHGAVAIYTLGGAGLVDGRAAVLEFAPSNVAAPHMRRENGLLSGLRINGVEVDTSAGNGLISGGGMAALFDIRDDLAVSAQVRLDSLARNLVERFQDPALDATRLPGGAGLLTDAGLVFDPADEVGLAGRVVVNAAVDPDQGGAAWRLRDGIGANTPGPAGNGALLQDLQAALTSATSLESIDDLGIAARAFSGHVSILSGRLSQDRLTGDEAQSFASAYRAELTAQEKAGGVDTDAEMQRLLTIEQVYAANARMIQVIDDMMTTLLRI